MKAFEIGKLNAQKNQIVVYSTNILSVEQCTEHLVESLKKMNFRGVVLFDLLLSNGNTDKRFCSMSFNGHSFDKNSKNVIQNMDSSILKESTEFYKKHSSYVENSVLTKSQKYLVKNGYSLYQLPSLI